jgi:peptide/nickel transport system ATP-binding protein
MLNVQGLTVWNREVAPVLDDVTMHIEPGESVGVVGESGSGKSSLAAALLGHVRAGLRRGAGTVRLDGADLFTLPPRELAQLRRQRLAHLGQEPGRTLTPTMRIGDLIAERLDHPDPEAVASVLTSVGLPGDQAFRTRLPHQLSGGQQQRVALARSLIGDPQILVLDEPTTGLDPRTLELVLDRLQRRRAQGDRALALISHDLAVVSRTTDRVLVLHEGRLVEHGPTDTVLRRPQDARTRAMVAALPNDAHRQPVRLPPARSSVLVVDGVRAVHRDPRTGGQHFNVLADLRLGNAECTALLGASGSGKSTLARVIVGLHEPEAGAVRLHGTDLAPAARRRTGAQRAAVQLVPQDATGSLNPRRRIGAVLARALRRQGRSDADVAALLSLVGLEEPLAARFPGQLSGGQRQRVAIARALAARPAVLVCDEVTSGLDAARTRSLLVLLEQLRTELSLAILLITHDLGVVARAADHVVVMDHGRVCERGTVRNVLDNPQHDVTANLLRAGRADQASW